MLRRLRSLRARVGKVAVNRTFTVIRRARIGEDGACPNPTRIVYQLRVVLREITPIIWRRLLVPAETTLAGLHDILQIVFAWSDEHLHRFVIHGADYDDDLAAVRLVDLGLRQTERFVYDYNFTDFWRHDLRVEQTLAGEPSGRYPRCTGGRRAGPPEECGGRPHFASSSQTRWCMAQRYEGASPPAGMTASSLGTVNSIGFRRRTLSNHVLVLLTACSSSSTWA